MNKRGMYQATPEWEAYVNHQCKLGNQEAIGHRQLGVGKHTHNDHCVNNKAQSCES